VRAYQVGPHATECTKLLNEIAQARQTLTNPAKRREYDHKLAAAAPPADTPPPQTKVTPREVKAAPPHAAGRPRWLLPAAIGGGVGVLALVGMVVALLRPRDSELLTPEAGSRAAVALRTKTAPPEVETSKPAPPPPA